MRHQVWYISILIGLMCLIRFGLSAAGYINPPTFMAEIGLSLSDNPQMPYAIRAWAIRDMVIAILVLLGNPGIIKTLLVGCAAIDLVDIISAYLSVSAGLFEDTNGWLLKLTSTAIVALFLELAALALLTLREAHIYPGTLRQE